MSARKVNRYVAPRDVGMLESMGDVARTLRHVLLGDGWEEPSGEHVSLAVVPDVNPGLPGIIRRIQGAALHRDGKQRGRLRHSLSLNWHEWESLEPRSRIHVPDSGAATLAFGDTPYSPVRVVSGLGEHGLDDIASMLYRASVDLDPRYDEREYDFHIRFDLIGRAAASGSTEFKDAAYEGRELLAEGLANRCRLPTPSIAAASALVIRTVVQPLPGHPDIHPD